MFTIALHMQTDTLEWLEPLAKHLGHVELALDYDSPQPTPPPHPVVKMVDEALHEREQARERKQVEMDKEANRYRVKLQREADRKRKARQVQRVESPKVIAAVYCMTCAAEIGEPCEGPSGIKFGFTGHTHLARRQAYANQKETQK